MATNQFDRANYPTIEPDRLVAGERWLWRKDDLASDYPPASYQLKYFGRSQESSSTEIAITAVEADSTYFIEVSSSDTQSQPDRLLGKPGLFGLATIRKSRFLKANGSLTKIRM